MSKPFHSEQAVCGDEFPVGGQSYLGEDLGYTCKVSLQVEGVDDHDLVFGSLGLPLMVRAWFGGLWRPRLPPERCSMDMVVCFGVHCVPSCVVCPTTVSHEGAGCYPTPVSQVGLCSSSPVYPEGSSCTISSVSPEVWRVLVPLGRAEGMAMPL